MKAEYNHVPTWAILVVGLCIALSLLSLVNGIGQPSQQQRFAAPAASPK